jgi:hypothetical protein
MRLVQPRMNLIKGERFSSRILDLSMFTVRQIAWARERWPPPATSQSPPDMEGDERLAGGGVVAPAAAHAVADAHSQQLGMPELGEATESMVGLKLLVDRDVH